MPDFVYNSNSRPRNKLKQFGSNNPYSTHSKPRSQRLLIYDNMALYEPVIRQGFEIIVGTLVGALGELTHPDPEIQAYLTTTVSRLTDMYNIDFKISLKQAIKATMQSGFSVTEALYELDKGVVYINDFSLYHPGTINIRTNLRGRLAEGEESIDSPYYKSGIYQINRYRFKQGQSETMLPLWKIAYLHNPGEIRSYYGTSMLEPCYRWHVLKEAYVDMKTETLDRFGNPLTVLIMPQVNSTAVDVDIHTGEERILSSQEYLQKQIESNNLGDGSFLFLPYLDPSLKPEVQTLTTGNNIGDMFIKAVKFCEQQMVRCLLVPYGFIEGELSSNSDVSERQIELFNKLISYCYRQFVVPYVSQTFHRAIKFNFNRESANQPPILPLRNITRPEQRVALMQTIKGLTDTGYLNPTDPVDWAWVRDTVESIPREQTKKDVEFVKQLLVYPRQPKEDSIQPGKKKVTTGETVPNRDRSTEGKVKGEGGKGRPSGVSSPLQKPRE
jgi:hypothetical protein